MLNRVLALPAFQSDRKGAEGREVTESLRGGGRTDFITKSLDLCVTSEEMIKSGSSL